MKTYIFTGSSSEDVKITLPYLTVSPLCYGLGFSAEVKADSLRIALSMLDATLSDFPCNIHHFYSITNSSGKISVRKLKQDISYKGFKGFFSPLTSEVQK